jgi:hypothetical protein
MNTLAIFLANPDGWPESPSGVLFRDDSTVGDDTMQMKHSLCLLVRTQLNCEIVDIAWAYTIQQGSAPGEAGVELGRTKICTRGELRCAAYVTPMHRRKFWFPGKFDAR